MQQLTLYAIAIDDVRDIFGAHPELASRLRRVAAEHFAAPTPPKKRWFKPLLRTDADSVVDPVKPSGDDVEILLAGGFIKPERAAQSWAILSAWLQHLATRWRAIPFERAAFERIEWDLARAGLNSDYSLRNLAERDLATPLRPLPDTFAGYAKHVHVVETLAALRDARHNHDLAPETVAFVDPILDVLVAVPSDERLDLVATVCDASD